MRGDYAGRMSSGWTVGRSNGELGTGRSSSSNGSLAVGVRARAGDEGAATTEESRLI